MNYKKLQEDFIVKNHLPATSLLDYKNDKWFECIKFKDIRDDTSDLAYGAFYDQNGELKYSFLKNGSPMHNLITGATGSGKTSCYLAHQILVAAKKNCSLIVVDNNGDILNHTYNSLKNIGKDVLIMDFRDSKNTMTFNPLSYIVTRCQKLGGIDSITQELVEGIAKILVPLDIKDDQTWALGGQDIIAGLIYEQLEDLFENYIDAEEINLYNTIQRYHWLIKNSSSSSIKPFKNFDNYYCNKDSSFRSIQKLQASIVTAEKTRAGFISVTSSTLEKINNNKVFELTSSNTLDIEELFKKQTILYIITGGLECANIVTQLFLFLFSKFVDIYVSDSKTIKISTPIHVFVDEFANVALGDQNELSKMLTTHRKHNIFYSFLIQNYHQLISKYSYEFTKTIINNCNSIFLNTNDYFTRDEFSKTCGLTTSFIKYNDLLSYKTHLLITPEELNILPLGKMIAQKSNSNPILCHFEPVFRCKEFSYNSNITNDHKNKNADFEKFYIDQGIIIPRISPSSWNKNLINDWFSIEEFDEIDEIHLTKECKNSKLLRKLLRGNIVTIMHDKSIKFLIDDELLVKVRRRWDFENDY